MKTDKKKKVQEVKNDVKEGTPVKMEVVIYSILEYLEASSGDVVSFDQGISKLNKLVEDYKKKYKCTKVWFNIEIDKHDNELTASILATRYYTKEEIAREEENNQEREMWAKDREEIARKEKLLLYKKLKRELKQEGIIK